MGSIDNSRVHKSILQIDAVLRKQTGILTCEAMNMHGSAKMSVQLTVHSKPSAPEDRLLVSNISSSGCKLNWTASKNSGGLPLELPAREIYRCFGFLGQKSHYVKYRAFRE